MENINYENVEEGGRVKDEEETVEDETLDE